MIEVIALYNQYLKCTVLENIIETRAGNKPINDNIDDINLDFKPNGANRII